MRRTSTMGSMGLSFPPFTPAVKQLLIANFAVFLLEAAIDALVWPGFHPWMDAHFGLVPALSILHGWVWQLVSYSFLHEGLLHILFNMLALWMFGAQLEIDWGYSLFMQFYFFCVIGAALTTIAVSFIGLLGANPLTTTVGASGGVFGLLLAFGILHGDSEIMLFPLPFLIKAKYFVIGIIGLALYGALSSAALAGTIHRLHGPPWRIVVRLPLPEVCAATGIRLRDYGALLRCAQCLLSLETPPHRP